MATYSVTIPIAGHAIVEVEADNEEAAIDKAMEEVTDGDLQSWEVLREVNAGNVCYFPSPWEATAEKIDD